MSECIDRILKAAKHEEQAYNNPNMELEDFYTRIADIINYEWDQRQTTKFNKLLKKATLKYPTADFDDAIYEEDRMLDIHTIELLQQCKWLDNTKKSINYR